MRSEKNTEMATRKKYNASTRPAIVDADSGKSGVPDHIQRVLGSSFRVRGSRFRVQGSTLAAQHDHNEAAEREDRRRARDAHRAHDRETVAAGHRVVVIAIQKQRIDRRSDLA